MNWPINIYKPADNFVRLKHFQYRNIQQIKQRIETRKNNTKDNNIFIMIKRMVLNGSQSEVLKFLMIQPI